MVKPLGSWRVAVVVLSLLLFGLLCPAARAAAGLGITYDSQRNDSSGQPGIWMMNSDGSHQAGFVAGGSEPSWSADGAKMVYLANSTAPHCLANGSTGGGITIVGPDGRNPQNLNGTCGDARISPDGTHVAFLTGGSCASDPILLKVLSAANPNFPAQIVPVPHSFLTMCRSGVGSTRIGACEFAAEPSWILSGAVAYANDTSLGGGLWSLPATGGSNTPTLIADDNTPGGLNYGISGESVNPTGTKIAVSTNFNSNAPESISVIPLGGSTGTVVATAPAGHNYVFPQWSPDGSTIVFEDDGPGNASRIDTVPATGGIPTVLTPNDPTARNPTFGPPPNTGGISGTVVDDVGDVPLSEGGVVVQATASNGQTTTATTDGNGQYKLSLPPATYTVTPLGHNFKPVSRQVTLTGFTSNVDFADEPIGVVTLGLEELSFGVATAQVGIPGAMGGLQTGIAVTKPVDHSSAQLQQDASTSKLFPIAFLDLYQPGTTTIVATYQLTNARIGTISNVGGQPLSEFVSVGAGRATRITVPSCASIPPSVDLAQAAQALVCPLTEAQKAAALAAYQKYSDEAANLKNSQDALGCFPHADREVALACAAIGVMRAYDLQQISEAKKILDDPPDPHFKKVAKPARVHPKKISGSRFKAFNSLIADLAQIGSLEAAFVTSANRESGAHKARSNKGVKLQHAAITQYAKQIIALEGKIARLHKAADKALSGFHAKRPPKQTVIIDFSDLLAGDGDLAAAMRPSAR